MEKVVKTTKPFRCDLNKIAYDFTVEVINRFKGLDLVACLKNYGQSFITRTGGSDQNHTPKKEMQEGKMVV